MTKQINECAQALVDNLAQEAGSENHFECKKWVKFVGKEIWFLDDKIIHIAVHFGNYELCPRKKNYVFLKKTNTILSLRLEFFPILLLG